MLHLARKKSTPICQDTGTLNFYIRCPINWIPDEIKKQIYSAVHEAEELNYLRPIAKDSWAEGSKDGNAEHHQSVYLHFEESSGTDLEIDLILKGGGCENVSSQFSLPDMTIQAERDLDGVRKAVLQAVDQAQGRGCAPGFLGIAVGGDRADGYEKAKRVLCEKIDSENQNPELAKLEKQITNEANSLGIGPMGFGGESTVLGTKITTVPRLPASFFVTVSYMCWAYRHRKLRVDNGIVTYS